MVHTFKFLYNQPYYFLWDIESGSLHSVDYVAFLCAKKRYNKDLTQKEEEDYSLLDQYEFEQINNDFNTLEKEGALNSPPLIKEFKKSSDEIKALCLHICHDCNLKCDYCFAGGGTYNTKKDYMSKEVGEKAVDFLIRNSGNRRNLEIDFFGGEPLMNLDVVKYIVDYAKEKAKENNKIFSFTLTTNCLLLNDKNADYLNKEMKNIVLSIDGRRDTHNYVRHSLSGKDCYDIILSNAQSFRKIRGNGNYYVRGTFTNKNLDFTEDILRLNDLGFDQISLEPVVLPDEHKLAIKKEHLDVIEKEYEKLAREYISRRKNDKWFNFFHYMIDLEHGPCVNKRLTGCGAGNEYLAVSPTGDIFPCHQFVGEKEYLLGDVFMGIDNQSKKEEFSENTLLTKIECANCIAKYFCGGGCAANAKNATGKISGVYKTGCALIKKRLEMSLAIYAIENNN